MKARHVADALQALLSCTEKNIATTWIRCCEISVKKNYNQVKRARTIADWYLDLHKTKSLKWRRSERGRASYFAKSPFAEDELLLMQFKSWARQDLEHLNIHKSREFINLKLLSDWTVQQLETNKILYPVSEFIVSR